MKKKIVVVDDEKPIADILQFQFQKQGFSVVCAHDGDEVLELIDKIQPDAVLLDVMLPGCNGIEICTEIRETYDMPIIMLTAHESEDNEKLAYNQGANEYVMKPFHTEDLIVLVEKKLKNKTGRVNIS